VKAPAPRVQTVACALPAQVPRPAGRPAGLPAIFPKPCATGLRNGHAQPSN